MDQQELDQYRKEKFMKIKSAVIREKHTFHHTVLFILFCVYVCCVTVIQCNLTYWLSHITWQIKHNVGNISTLSSLMENRQCVLYK